MSPYKKYIHTYKVARYFDELLTKRMLFFFVVVMLHEKVDLTFFLL